MLKLVTLIALVSTAAAFSVPVDHHRGSVAVNQSDILSVPDDALPSVGIMIPTNSRPEFVAHALLQISKQAYPKKKLSILIIDDSPAHLRVGELQPGKQTHLGLPVEYVVLDSVVSIGKTLPDWKREGLLPEVHLEDRHERPDLRDVHGPLDDVRVAHVSGTHRLGDRQVHSVRVT